MAIFAGTWVDGSGDPFDPNAHVLQTWTGGGMAANTRRAIAPHPGHPPFIAAARYSARRWFDDVIPADRANWALKAATGTPKRGSIDRTPTNGFIHFNAYDLIQLYADPPSSVAETAADTPSIASTSLDSIAVGAQTITHSIVADAGFPDVSNARVAVFQIHPAAVRFNNPWRATRLVDLVAAADFVGLGYTATVDLRWPVAAGDTVRLYWRARLFNWWKYESDAALVA